MPHQQSQCEIVQKKRDSEALMYQDCCQRSKRQPVRKRPRRQGMESVACCDNV